MTLQFKTVTATVKAVKDESPHGTFDVILSAQTKDRDGDVLKSDGWKTPLPDHIPFDIDHGMSVEKTVGSGKPFINENGDLQVRGTFASTPLGQQTRTLINEGHIKTTSVAFMNEKVPQKDGTSTVIRELLNGAFVAIPSNREALILSAKGLKAGARNSSEDMQMIQAIHDHAAGLGGACSGPQKAWGRKDADTEDGDNPNDLISAVDASIDQAIDLLSTVDATSLPAEVQQAIALIQAADATIDGLMDILGIPDPDEGNGGESVTGASVPPGAGAGKSAPAPGVAVAPTAEKSNEIHAMQEYRARLLAALSS